MRARIYALTHDGSHPQESTQALVQGLNEAVNQNEEYFQKVQVASQNTHWNKGGAFTGEMSAAQVKDFGLEWAIIGHSERRANHESGYGVMANETPETAAKKARYALGQGLNVFFCFGETAEHRKAGLALDVCKMMLWPLIAQMAAEDWDKLVLAYEPVWAIGTGRAATVEEADLVHKGLRSFLAEFISPEVAKKVRITYGGSVTPSNAVELAAQPNIDGFLVGGASLEADKFVDIIAAAANAC
eukprot:jgi/Tetstr1/443689/TSEL_031679.t1